MSGQIRSGGGFDPSGLTILLIIAVLVCVMFVAYALGMMS